MSENTKFHIAKLLLGFICYAQTAWSEATQTSMRQLYWKPESKAILCQLTVLVGVSFFLKYPQSHHRLILPRLSVVFMIS